MTLPNDQHEADAYDAEHGPTREDYADLDGAEPGESA